MTLQSGVGDFVVRQAAGPGREPCVARLLSWRTRPVSMSMTQSCRRPAPIGDERDVTAVGGPGRVLIPARRRQLLEPPPCHVERGRSAGRPDTSRWNGDDDAVGRPLRGVRAPRGAVVERREQLLIGAVGMPWRRSAAGPARVETNAMRRPSGAYVGERLSAKRPTVNRCRQHWSAGHWPHKCSVPPCSSDCAKARNCPSGENAGVMFSCRLGARHHLRRPPGQQLDQTIGPVPSSQAWYTRSTGRPATRWARAAVWPAGVSGVMSAPSLSIR